MKQPPDAAGFLQEALAPSAGLLDLSRQQRNILLFQPLFQLERNKPMLQAEPGGGSIFEGIDTHYLLLAALDHMMEATTISMGSTSAEILEFLTETAIRMRSGLDAAAAGRIATAVLDALDNKANKHREFATEYFDAASGSMKTFRFRLVQFLPDPQDVYRYTPSAEGYLVYLGMLDLEVEDAQVLMEKMLDLLVKRGRFEAALDIAKRARKLSLEYRQLIKDKLNQAFRAPATVNWSKEMDSKLKDARVHVQQRQSEDVRMEQAVGDTLNETHDLQARENLIQLLETLRAAGLIRMQLVSDITTAPEKFIAVQKNAFRARRPMGLPDLETTIFPALMQGTAAFLAQEADTFLSALYPPQPLRIFDLNTVFALLMDNRAEDTPPAQDDGELAHFEPIPERFPKDLVDMSKSWIAGKFETGAAWQVDELLLQAAEEGLPQAVQECLVFILYQSFAESENTFEGTLARKGDGRFVLKFVQGDNVEFFRKESP